MLYYRLVQYEPTYSSVFCLFVHVIYYVVLPSVFIFHSDEIKVEISHEDKSSCPFRDMSHKTWSQRRRATLPGTPQSLRVINRQLWACCLDVGIVVFNSELQQQRVIQRDDVVYDAVPMTSGDGGDILVATSTGVYCATDPGPFSFFFPKIYICYTLSIKLTYLINKPVLAWQIQQRA